MKNIAMWKGIRFALVALSLLLVKIESNGAVLVVLNTDPTGPGSLRQALLDANATSGKDTIAFQIPGAGVHTIVLNTPLPPVNDPWDPLESTCRHASLSIL